MKYSIKKLLAIMAAITVAAPIVNAAAIKVDENVKSYVKSNAGVGGELNSVGSDTLNNLMTLWSEGFQKLYPNVKIQVEGKGSSTAPPALIEGTSHLGPMSRKMKSKELDKFEEKFGFKPTKIGVALDSLAVFVNKDNTTKSLSLPQVDALFSKNRKGGFGSDIATWGQLSLEGNWKNLPISLYGRNSASGTYGYFKKKALFKGDFKDSVKEQPGSASVVMGITEDKAGIGYSGIGYQTSGVRALSLSKKHGGTAYEPSYTNVLNGKYPLARMLYVYFVKKPNQKADTTIAEFLKYVLSKKGQEVVVKDGYLPLPASMVEKQLKMLN